MCYPNRTAAHESNTCHSVGIWRWRLDYCSKQHIWIQDSNRDGVWWTAFIKEVERHVHSHCWLFILSSKVGIQYLFPTELAEKISYIKFIAHPHPTITTVTNTIRVNNECALITSKSLIIIWVLATDRNKQNTDWWWTIYACQWGSFHFVTHTQHLPLKILGQSDVNKNKFYMAYYLNLKLFGQGQFIPNFKQWSPCSFCCPHSAFTHANFRPYWCY